MTSQSWSVVKTAISWVHFCFQLSVIGWGGGKLSPILVVTQCNGVYLGILKKNKAKKKAMLGRAMFLQILNAFPKPHLHTHSHTHSVQYTPEANLCMFFFSWPITQWPNTVEKRDYHIYTVIWNSIPTEKCSLLELMYLSYPQYKSNCKIMNATLQWQLPTSNWLLWYKRHHITISPFIQKTTSNYPQEKK